ncbi:Vacuolar protein sorting protein [Strigomonas culicis]|uniref:Vacuolar protein sorting protein n=1 Tax=Strigomonas culicis TaxID=28005 RepID=S9V8B5_9TRYP|nr:Vacuolar protein sorting protein [Strigomonas culicis]|eukprot:EPY23211.1 Vacuolar protein sorting protein [Strigomonas culicis]
MRSPIFDLDDLESIQLDDEFVIANIGKQYNEDDARKMLQNVCTEFAQAYLVEQAESISFLYDSLSECSTVLKEMEDVLETFISQLRTIQRDIGEVRETLSRTSVTLTNTRRAEKVLWIAVSRLVVPPEVIQVVTQASEEQLGTQFELCVRQLLTFLNYRKGTWKQFNSGSKEESERDDDPSLREVRISLRECKVYMDLMRVLDSVTVYTCIKIKNILSKKLQVLTAKNTNTCIQQEHTLKSSAFYVHFLRNAVSLLRHAHSGGQEGERQNTLVPYRIVKALYNEFKGEYCVILAEVYLRKIQDYVFVLNSMEIPTVSGATANIFGGGPAAASKLSYTLPEISNCNVSPEAFALQERDDIFRRMFAPPLIPTMEKASRRRHSYEETFRSTLNLICDIVTHEYIFTFQFFSGDMSVYIEVFKPTVQFLVDYLAEVVLTQASGETLRRLNGRPYTSVNTNAKNDCYGLLILVRLCHEYRCLMRYTRLLNCLDGFYDSLLLLLWPAFKKTFEHQIVSLRCMSTSNYTGPLRSFPQLKSKLCAIHPIAKNFAAFSDVILDILLGAIFTERQLRSKSERDVLRHPQQQEGSGSSASSLSESFDDREAFNPWADSADLSSIRVRALQMITEEEESDAAESSNHLTVSVGTVSFMYVEVVHFLDKVCLTLFTEESSETTRAQLVPFQNCFLLNNMYVMLEAPKRLGLFPQKKPVADENEGNFVVVQEIYDNYRAEFVEQILKACYPQFFMVIKQGEQAPAQDVRAAAEHFSAYWKTCLDTVRTTVHSLITHPGHQQEITAQTCMECLLLNTRFHTVVAQKMETEKEVFRDCTLRSLIVTNQSILQHMRTFATISANMETM